MFKNKLLKSSPPIRPTDHVLRKLSAILVCSFLLQDVTWATPDLKPIEWNKKEDHISWAKALLPDIPESVATIEDAHKSPKASKTLILIQDAHTNNSGQINVAKTLDLIFKKDPLQYVFLEAGSGDESLSFLRKYASKEKRREVAHSFLINGKLQGTEYLDLTSNHNFILWGVEDLSLYANSLAIYRAVTKERDKILQYLTRIESTIKTLKPKIYNPALFAFDEKYQKYQKDEMSSAAYFEALDAEAKKLDISFSNYPHLQALHKLKKMESKIDFKKASDEEALAVASLSSEAQKELFLASKDNQSPSKLSFGENQAQKAFFALLEEKITPQLNQYPELSKYLLHLKEAKKIQAKPILEEQKALENEVFTARSRTQDEEDLIKASENLECLKKLIKLALTPDEFDSYQKNKQSFDIVRLTGFMNKGIMDLKGPYGRAVFLESGYEDIVRICEEFYFLTLQRDQKFIENLTQKMNAENQEKAILITGGYHTPNLKHLLKDRGISYVSLTPQVLQETNQKRYEELLLNQKIDSFLHAPSKNSRVAIHANMLMRILWLSSIGGRNDHQELALSLGGPKTDPRQILDAMNAQVNKLSGIGPGPNHVDVQLSRTSSPPKLKAAARLATISLGDKDEIYREKMAEKGYKLLERVGEGKQVVVFRAEDPAHQTVAVKIVYEPIASDYAYPSLDRIREIRDRLGKGHPNVEKIIDAGSIKINERSHPYVIAEYIQGCNVQEYINMNAEFDFRSRYELMFPGIKAGCAYLEETNIGRPDASPSNIMLRNSDPTQPVQIDFLSNLGMKPDDMDALMIRCLMLILTGVDSFNLDSRANEISSSNTPEGELLRYYFKNRRERIKPGELYGQIEEILTPGARTSAVADQRTRVFLALAAQEYFVSDESRIAILIGDRSRIFTLTIEGGDLTATAEGLDHPVVIEDFKRIKADRETVEISGADALRLMQKLEAYVIGNLEKTSYRDSSIAAHVNIDLEGIDFNTNFQPLLLKLIQVKLDERFSNVSFTLTTSDPALRDRAREEFDRQADPENSDGIIAQLNKQASSSFASKAVDALKVLKDDIFSSGDYPGISTVNLTSDRKLLIQGTGKTSRNLPWKVGDGITSFIEIDLAIAVARTPEIQGTLPEALACAYRTSAQLSPQIFSTHQIHLVRVINGQGITGEHDPEKILSLIELKPILAAFGARLALYRTLIRQIAQSA